jgi:DGQHR domain-containing protein
MSHVHTVCEVEEGRSYFATITPPGAEELLFISTYDDQDPLSQAVGKHGYQRPPTTSRFKEIAKHFLQNGNRYRIPPIIVSVRISDAAEIQRFLKLLADGDLARIREEFGSKIVSIVDGQHRYKGLLTAHGQDSGFLPNIPMMMYFGLTFEQEAELFNTINVTQRKLPKALIETNRGDITEANEQSYGQQIRRITFSLCRDDDSVWGPIDGVEQINMTGARDPNRPVTYEGLRRSMSNMFPQPLLTRLMAIDEELPTKYAKRYWRAVSEACHQGWTGRPAERREVDQTTGQTHMVKIKYRLKDLVGVASLAKLGSDIVRTHVDSGEKGKLEELVERLSVVDWEKRDDNPWMRSQAGFAGQKDLYLKLHELVYLKAAEDDFIENAEFEEAFAS